MKVIHTIEQLQGELRGKGKIGIVPTMGNLHDGHLALVEEAKKHCDFLVVSVFVNRLQFGPNEDFDTYPRTLDEDCRKLEQQGKADIVFAPSEKDMYPEEQTYKICPDPRMADILEGFYRKGFFTGVCTVVGKLFSIVRPDIAVFGKKDYQQLQIIRSMVRQFGMPIQIIGHELQRDKKSGLALSSRNRYLNADELVQAPELYHVLQQVKKRIESGDNNIAALEIRAVEVLKHHGWEPDYVAVVRQRDLLAPTRDDVMMKVPLVVLAAAKIGSTRLIDNIEIF